MTGQAYVDPAALRAFAGDLQRLVFVAGDALRQLEDRVSGLGRTWEDTEYQVFKESAAAMSRVLSQFAHDAHRFARYVATTADDADQIHKGHFLPTTYAVSPEWRHAVEHGHSYEVEKGEVFFCGKCNRQQHPKDGELCRICKSVTVSWFTDREDADTVKSRWRLINGAMPPGNGDR